jgi:hypothetical protein
MTAIYLLSLGMLALVLKTGLGTRELNRRRFTLPLAIVAVVGALWLRSIPTSAGDIKLITVTGAAGVLLGLVAGALMKVRVTEDGSLVTVAGISYAAIWIAAIGSRLLFAYGASHWFAPEVASLSRGAGIDSSASYTAAFVVIGRSAREAPGSCDSGCGGTSSWCDSAGLVSQAHHRRTSYG